MFRGVGDRPSVPRCGNCSNGRGPESHARESRELPTLVSSVTEVIRHAPRNTGDPQTRNSAETCDGVSKASLLEMSGWHPILRRHSLSGSDFARGACRYPVSITDACAGNRASPFLRNSSAGRPVPGFDSSPVLSSASMTWRRKASFCNSRSKITS